MNEYEYALRYIKKLNDTDYQECCGDDLLWENLPEHFKTAIQEALKIASRKAENPIANYIEV